MSRAERRSWGRHLQLVPRSEWPDLRYSPISRTPIEVWRSSRYLVQVYDAGDGYERLTVCRAVQTRDPRKGGGLTWDELQAIKRGVGRGERAAVEIYPPDAEVVDVADMRHLWVYPPGDYPSRMWRRRAS